MSNTNPAVAISDIKVRLVEDGTDGLIAWASCVVAHAIKLDNVAIRRGRAGVLFLTYPAKQTTTGERHYYFSPVSAEAAQVIESAILTRLAALAKAAAAPAARNL